MYSLLGYNAEEVKKLQDEWQRKSVFVFFCKLSVAFFMVGVTAILSLGL